MHAVVDVRPSRSTASGRDRTAAAPGRARELQPRSSRGFIIDGQGLIITSDQRLNGASSFDVTLDDGRMLRAIVVARDMLNDVTVLKLKHRGLPAIPLGDSGALAVGERVLAIGNGGGLDRTPTAASVLATGAGTGGHLAVDLTPRPEGVGGPLLNHLGQAVGIVTDSASPTGGRHAVTFAVPLDRVKSILRNLASRPPGLPLPPETQ